MAITQTDGEALLERKAFLIGMPIRHSISPLLHHTLYASIGQPRWGQIVCESSDLAGHLTKMRSDPSCMGSGVTMPHKVAVMPLLDSLTPEAAAIGAVNTIVPRTSADGRTKTMVGTNTDCIGIRDAFFDNTPDDKIYRGRPALVVGGGGTCRAAVYALQHYLGCRPIYIINRDRSEVDAVILEGRTRGVSPATLVHVSSVAQATTLEPPAAIVSAVPNFTPQTEAERTVRSILTHFLDRPQKGVVLEMCYHPSPTTQISKLATAAGWRVLLGTEALIGQGMEQAKLWTGIEITPDMQLAVRKAVDESLYGAGRD